MKWEDRAELAFRIAGVYLLTLGLVRGESLVSRLEALLTPGGPHDVLAWSGVAVFVAVPVLGFLLMTWGKAPARWLITRHPRPVTRFQEDLSMGFVLLGCLLVGVAVASARGFSESRSLLSELPTC